MGLHWPAVQAAHRRDDSARLPFFIGPAWVGSVGRHHLEALRQWPQWLQLHDNSVVLVATDANAALGSINAALHQQGLVQGWRDELFTVTCLNSARSVACIERAAARFWGTLTLGAHATGYVADQQGRPTHLWLARRSLAKATDPGMLDNLIGGGVAQGQTPWQALVREGWEEAGLSPAQMAGARRGRVFRLQRDIAQGLQREDIHSHDLLLPAGVSPVNQDGEVHSFECLPLEQALALAASDQMTVDASLVTLDFALRHRLCAVPPGAEALFRDA